MLAAIADVMKATGWDPAAFRAAIGADPDHGKYFVITRVHGSSDDTFSTRDHIFHTSGLVAAGRSDVGLHVYDLFGEKGENYAKRWFVHELAHRIDAVAGESTGRCAGTGWISCNLAATIGANWEEDSGRVKYVGGVPGKQASGWVTHNPVGPNPDEDWAETFTYMVYAKVDPNVLNADPRWPLTAPDSNRQHIYNLWTDYYRDHSYDR